MFMVLTTKHCQRWPLQHARFWQQSLTSFWTLKTSRTKSLSSSEHATTKDRCLVPLWKYDIGLKWLYLYLEHSNKFRKNTWIFLCGHAHWQFVLTFNMEVRLDNLQMKLYLGDVPQCTHTIFGPFCAMILVEHFGKVLRRSSHDNWLNLTENLLTNLHTWSSFDFVFSSFIKLDLLFRDF